MDAFFASVEQLDDPSLRGKPVIVGGAGRRGVVAAASYEARPFGVRSAMPTAMALARCPQAIVVTPHRERYEQVSAQVFAIFRTYTPLVEGLSVDEAFLDVTGSRSLFGDGEAIARRIRAEIRETTGLTASAGVASSKFVAKIASDLKKPDGLVVVPPGTERAFLRDLPIERMWGIGEKTAPTLRRMGFRTLGDLAGAELSVLATLLGEHAAGVRERAAGLDDREVVPHADAKTVGAETTFAHDLTTIAELERALLSQSARVARRLLVSGLSAGAVTVKLKLADFTLLTRQKRLENARQDTDGLYDAARDLLPRFGLDHFRVRLTGVAAGGLVKGPPPRTLFPDKDADRKRKLEEVALAVAARFGDAGIKRATLLELDDEQLDGGIGRRDALTPSGSRDRG